MLFKFLNAFVFVALLLKPSNCQDQSSLAQPPLLVMDNFILMWENNGQSTDFFMSVPMSTFGSPDGWMAVGVNTNGSMVPHLSIFIILLI
jgi:hypothetical protein